MMGYADQKQDGVFSVGGCAGQEGKRSKPQTTAPARLDTTTAAQRLLLRPRMTLIVKLLGELTGSAAIPHLPQSLVHIQSTKWIIRAARELRQSRRQAPINPQSLVGRERTPLSVGPLYSTVPLMASPVASEGFHILSKFRHHVHTRPCLVFSLSRRWILHF